MRKPKQILKVVFAVLLFIVELLGMKHFYGNHSVSQLFVLVLYCAVADVVIWQSFRAFLLSENVNRLGSCSGRYTQLFVLMLAAFAVAVIWEGFTVLGSPASHFRILLTGIKSGSSSFSDVLLRDILFISKRLFSESVIQFCCGEDQGCRLCFPADCRILYCFWLFYYCIRDWVH